MLNKPLAQESSFPHSPTVANSLSALRALYIFRCLGKEIFMIPNNGAHTGTEIGHKWIIYFVFVCFLTPLSLRSIFRCKDAFHYCAFDKALAELSGPVALSGEIKTQTLL